MYGMLFSQMHSGFFCLIDDLCSQNIEKCETIGHTKLTNIESRPHGCFIAWVKSIKLLMPSFLIPVTYKCHRRIKVAVEQLKGERNKATQTRGERDQRDNVTHKLKTN